jgi:hypothetical protein
MELVFPHFWIFSLKSSFPHAGPLAFLDHIPTTIIIAPIPRINYDMVNTLPYPAQRESLILS